MSGGRFNYNQFKLEDIRNQIQEYIDKNNKELTEKEIDEHWLDREYFEKYPEEKLFSDYSDETISEFKKSIDLLKKAQIYVHRIDWLLSGDDSEKTFHERLKEELDKLENEKNT